MVSRMVISTVLKTLKETSRAIIKTDSDSIGMISRIKTDFISYRHDFYN